MKRTTYLGRTTRQRPAMCLACGAVLTAATGIGQRHKPRAGNIAICFKCGHLQAFAWDLQFRELTSEELVDLADNEIVAAARRAQAKYLQWKKEHGK